MSLLLSDLLNQLPFLSLSDTSAEFPGIPGETPHPLLIVQTDKCHARLALYGAQLLTFATPDQGDHLWVSPQAIFKPGKAIRGGIPVCLPWFGPHPQEPGVKPQHGFARTTDWVLSDAKALDGGDVAITLSLEAYRQQPSEHFPFQFAATLTFIFGDALQARLSVTNLDKHPMPLTWALHSYFSIEDSATAQVTGLDGYHYLDNLNGLTPEVQSGNIGFPGPVDSLFIDVGKTQEILSKPHLRVSGENCHSAIVWNPGKEAAATIADIGAEHVNGYICVERGNAAKNAIELQPGETHEATMTIAAVKI